MPEEVEEKASWLLQRLQAECCEAGAWVENKGIVLALHHEAWRDKTAIGEISYTLQIKMAVVNSVCFSDTHLHF